MCVNSESVSNEIDENDLKYEKHPEQSIWTWRGIALKCARVNSGDAQGRGPRGKENPRWNDDDTARAQI
jgi:hypothetical protein